MTELEPDRDNPSRRWKIPSRVFGRARTSTVLLGICFVLTALLYGQIRPEPPGTVETPQVPASSEVAPRPEQETSVSSSADPTTSVESTGNGDPTSTAPSGGAGSSTTGDGRAGTEDPTFLPGVTVPPQLRSLVPPAPTVTATP